MSRLLLALATVWCCAPTLADEARLSSNGRENYTRPPVKEPQYESTPKYCLIVLGRRGETKIWMVEDGKRLFVDKNANGDLTDDGQPIEPSDVRSLSSNRWDFNYVLDEITPADGSRHTQFDLRRWNYGEKKDSYGLSLTVDGKLPIYAGWFGTFWSTKREEAPVLHFGGPFTPKLLRKKKFTVGSGQRRLSLAFINRGPGAGETTRLSIDALPPDLVPVLNIEWPTAGDGAPLRTSHQLTKRCCYWEFYTMEFEVPKGAVAGQANVSVEFPSDAVPIELTTTEFQAPVVAESRTAATGLGVLIDGITETFE